MRHKIDLDQLDSVIARIKGFEGFLDDQIATLDHAIGKLQNTWDGDAADAQHNSHTRLMSAAREIHEGIREMRESAQDAHEAYTAAIQANIEMWRS